MRFMKYAGAFCQSKRHHCELKLPVSGDKGCLWDIALPNLELEISGSQIDLGEVLGPF